MATSTAGDPNCGELTVNQLTVQNPAGISQSNLHGTTYIWDDGLQVGDQSSNSQAPLIVYGATTLYGDVTIGTSNQQAALQGSLSVYGPTTLYGSLTVEQDQPTKLMGNLEVAGTLTLHAGIGVSAFSADTSLSPGDDLTVPTQLAVKTYVGSQVSPISQALSQKAALAGSTSQPFAAQSLSVAMGVRVDLGAGNTFSLGDSGTVEVDAPGLPGGRLTILDNGNVGIRTPSPNSTLDVRGTLYCNAINITDAQGVPYQDNWIGMASNFDQNEWLHIGGITDNGMRRMALVANTIYLAGSVGIGTTNPQDQLVVGGAPTTFSVGSFSAAPIYGTSYAGFNATRTPNGWLFNSDSANNGGGIVYTNIFGQVFLVSKKSTGVGQDQRSDQQLITDTTDAVWLMLDPSGSLMLKKPGQEPRAIA
jgi:hypothetical protein